MYPSYIHSEIFDLFRSIVLSAFHQLKHNLETHGKQKLKYLYNLSHDINTVRYQVRIKIKHRILKERTFEIRIDYYLENIHKILHGKAR